MFDWLYFWFIRSDGWQAMVAGVMGGLAVQALVNGMWRAYHRSWPKIGCVFYFAKLTTWLLVPYNLLSWYALGIGTIANYYDGYRGFFLILQYALIRIPVLAFVAKRKDFVVFDLISIVFEAAIVHALYGWILVHIYHFNVASLMQ